MAGETNLEQLIASMQPELVAGSYVFCTLANGKYGDYAQRQPLACFQEKEGLTLVLSKEQADNANLSYSGVFRLLSLKVHSSLEAVGLTAAISTCLAKAGISANVIAAYYHDHILVPETDAERALSLLAQLSKN